MLEEKIHNLIEPMITQLGLNLVQVKLSGNAKGKTLQVLLEQQNGAGGVNVDNCQKISRSIGALLDVEEVLSDRYYLEVSSAGLERPLIKKADFERFNGFLIAVKLKLKNEFGTKKLSGRIKSVTDEGFIIIDEDKKTDVLIEFYNLDDAKLIATEEMFKSKGISN
jgi:ribosome maturation factor RimP